MEMLLDKNTIKKEKKDHRAMIHFVEGKNFKLNLSALKRGRVLRGGHRKMESLWCNIWLVSIQDNLKHFRNSLFLPG